MPTIEESTHTVKLISIRSKKSFAGTQWSQMACFDTQQWQDWEHQFASVSLKPREKKPAST